MLSRRSNSLCSLKWSRFLRYADLWWSIWDFFEFLKLLSNHLRSLPSWFSSHRYILNLMKSLLLQYSQFVVDKITICIMEEDSIYIITAWVKILMIERHKLLSFPSRICLVELPLGRNYVDGMRTQVAWQHSFLTCFQGKSSFWIMTCK